VDLIYVLDSSAMIAYLNHENGAEIVKGLIQDPGATCLAHGLNLCEVYYDAHRHSGEAAAESVVAELAAEGVIERSDLDPDFWRTVGRMKSDDLRRISLADACGVVLTQRAAGHFVTSDHHELDRVASAGACSILFIR
jgi:PIN domain nuclease of toxin-antitoxin system